MASGLVRETSRNQDFIKPLLLSSASDLPAALSKHPADAFKRAI
jgi:hypothetical protein